jgi:diguanylate cyclase (GGDEF)-like protein
MPEDPRTNLTEAVAAALAGVGEIDDVLTELLDDLGPFRSEPVRARALEELRALLHVATAISAAKDLDDILDRTLDHACRAIGADALALSRFDAGDQIRVLANVGDVADWEEPRPEDETYSVADYEWTWSMISSGEPFLFSASDPAAPAIAADLVRSEGKEYALMVPIAVGTELWGDLWATRTADRPAFDARSFRVGVAVAHLIAGALERVELFDRIAALAHTDDLTGLANRRALEERLAAALGGRFPEVTVAICDVDRFKRVNDRLGHEEGDRVLMAVAAALEDAAGEAPVARAGGDEFWVLLEGAPSSAAEYLAREVTRRLLAPGRPAPGLSWGVASAREGSDPAGLLRRADVALYAAKQAGRGRLCVADSVAPEMVVPEVDPVVRRTLRAHEEGAAAGLDGLQGGTPGERLSLVASVLAEDLDAAAWLLSRIRDGSLVLERGWESELDAASGLRTVRPARIEPMSRVRYPPTATAVAREEAYHVDIGDPALVAAEREFLDWYGYRGALTVGVRTKNGDEYVLELFADERTAPLEPFCPVLQRLARRAASV